jgi:hypothetical protein
MTRTTTTVSCPHCEAEIEVRIETQAALAPSLKLPFSTPDEFTRWLKASRISIDEFKRLPLYQWHHDQLEPFIRALGSDPEDEAALHEGSDAEDEAAWHDDQLAPLTRGRADDATERAQPTRPRS